MVCGVLGVCVVCGVVWCVLTSLSVSSSDVAIIEPFVLTLTRRGVVCVVCSGAVCADVCGSCVVLCVMCCGDVCVLSELAVLSSVSNRSVVCVCVRGEREGMEDAGELTCVCGCVGVCVVFCGEVV